jgi:MOSC domain-containing protein YiiM
MILRSVNTAGITQVLHRDQLVGTAIFKRPVEGPVAVSTTNLAGDKQADLVNHGGVDKAVYGYPWEHYATWARELDRTDFSPGQFGENLTTEGLLEANVAIGDRLRVGTVVLEITQPRQPCFKLGLRMKLPGFPKLFLKSHRTGFYFRVLEEGTLTAGDSITLEPTSGNRVSVEEANRLRFFETENHERIRYLLDNPALSDAWRNDFCDLLERRV